MNKEFEMIGRISEDLENRGAVVRDLVDAIFEANEDDFLGVASYLDKYERYDGYAVYRGTFRDPGCTPSTSVLESQILNRYVRRLQSKDYPYFAKYINKDALLYVSYTEGDLYVYVFDTPLAMDNWLDK